MALEKLLLVKEIVIAISVFLTPDLNANLWVELNQ
jgi:hypothetical protein